MFHCLVIKVLCLSVSQTARLLYHIHQQMCIRDRVLTVNGKVTAAHHRCMADAAEKFGNGNLLYTTRLSVEIQGIPYDKIEEFQEFIAKEGLVTGGTGAKAVSYTHLLFQWQCLYAFFPARFSPSLRHILLSTHHTFG